MKIDGNIESVARQAISAIGQQRIFFGQNQFSRQNFY